MRVQAKIQKWGNSLGVRLTGPLREIPHFSENMVVDIDVTEKGLKISPAKTRKLRKLPFTEDTLLRGLTPSKAHADELAPPTDKEWGGE